MVFLIESIVACAVFTLFVYLISRDPVKIVYNYPPAIIDRCRSLGLVDDFNRRGGTAFWGGVLTAYALWVVVNWWDALVLDCLWFCHDKHFIITGRKIW